MTVKDFIHLKLKFFFLLPALGVVSSGTHSKRPFLQCILYQPWNPEDQEDQEHDIKASMSSQFYFPKCPNPAVAPFGEKLGNQENSHSVLPTPAKITAVLYWYKSWFYTHYRDENHPQWSSHETQPLFSLLSKEFAGEITINTEQRTLTGVQRVCTNTELFHPKKWEQILPAPPGFANPPLIWPSTSCISNNPASKEIRLVSSWEPLRKHMCL